jgi:hypothetical protein
MAISFRETVLEQYGFTAGVHACPINFLWEEISNVDPQTDWTVLAASAPWEMSVDERRRAMVGVESAIRVLMDRKRDG